MALEWLRIALDTSILVAILSTIAYVHHVRRAMQRAAERAAGAGLERAEHMVGAALAAQRAETDRIVAAITDLAAASPWRRPPPPPVTMAHADRVERPPEQADTWPDLPEAPTPRRAERPARPDITFPTYSGDDATINDRTLTSERDR